MTEERLDRLADAVLDAWESGAQVDYGAAAGEASFRSELAALERAATLAAAAVAAQDGNRSPMPAAFAARMLAVGTSIAAGPPGSAIPAAPLVGRPVDRAGLLGPLLLGVLLGLAGGVPLGAKWFSGGEDADPAAQLAQLVASAPTRMVAFRPGPTEGFGRARGDVVWSDVRQEGYLRLDGLEPLPQEQQYQLWIVDVHRIGAPVDGGVFDLAPDGTHIVPIEPKLRVREAKAFVVTVEPRGGVVVSDQRNVVAIASL